MNIYHVSWLQAHQYGLNAVVIAETADAALQLLDLAASNTSGVEVATLGPCTSGATAPEVICCEQL